MNRSLSSILFAILLLIFVPMSPVLAQDSEPVHPLIFGYAYLDQAAGPDLWSVGNVFTVVTIAEPNDLAIIPLDNVVNEYTVVLENVRVANYSESGGFGFVEFETGMVFSAYEDPRGTGTSADFGTTFPPNAQAPSSFIDGTRIAYSGTASDEFYLRIHLASNTGYFVWAEGLPIRNCALLGPGFNEFLEIWGWIALPGADVNPPLELPAPGYLFRLISQSDCDSPVQPGLSTWGQIKALYR